MNSDSQSFRKISYQTLLSVYALVPLTVIVVLIDRYGFHGVLRRALPQQPEQLRLYLLLLVFPHIVSSALSFADNEYLHFYGTKLMRALVLALGLGVLLPLAVSHAVTFAIYVIYTTYHNMAQQIGVSMFMAGKPTRWFKCWKWCVILTATLIFYLALASVRRHFPHEVHLLLNTAAAGLYLMVGLTGIAAWQSRTRKGMLYMWANCALVVCTAWYFRTGYYCFAIALIRVIHDFTGFAFYIVHDANRNQTVVHNRFYRLFRFMPLPIYVASPIVAIALANLLVQYKAYPFIDTFLITLGYFHYYTEGFMWKRDAKHRDFVPVIDGSVLA